MRTRHSITFWARQRTLYTKAVTVDARQDGAPAEAHFITPLIGHLGASIPSKSAVMAYISRLFFRCGPAYISLFVVSVVVNAIYRMFGRRFRAKFGIKFFERVEPKLDTTFSIQTVCSMGWGCASRFSTAITFVFRRLFFSRSESVLGIAQTSDVSLKTSARFSMRAVMSQTVGSYDFPRSTVAFAQPLGLPLFVVTRKADSDQSSKTLIAKITSTARRMARDFSIFTSRHFASYLGDLFRVGMSASIARPTRFIIHDFVVV